MNGGCSMRNARRPAANATRHTATVGCGCGVEWAGRRVSAASPSAPGERLRPGTPVKPAGPRRTTGPGGSRTMPGAAAGPEPLPGLPEAAVALPPGPASCPPRRDRPLPPRPCPGPDPDGAAAFAVEELGCRCGLLLATGTLVDRLARVSAWGPGSLK